MGGCRDWLVLSLKHSVGVEWLVWYRTDDCGYTTDLMEAGRYTEEEAREREMEGETLAVPLKAALASAFRHVMVDASGAVVMQLGSQAKAATTKGGTEWNSTA